MTVCNGGAEVFGWGDNSQMQITGVAYDKTISEPLLISYFSGKKIVGVYAGHKNSVLYIYQEDSSHISLMSKIALCAMKYKIQIEPS